MSNTVAKIKKKNYIKWSYIPTKNNPADLGSRGCQLNNFQVSGGAILCVWGTAKIAQNSYLLQAVSSPR